MPVFFLTPQNCSFAKRALRARLLQVKSSHLSEALATALGFRTHAALLAAMNHWGGERPALVQVDPTQLSRRLQDLGYRPIDPSDLVEIVRMPDLPVAAWREFRNRDLAANGIWFRECQRRDIPNVCIRLRTKYAELSWDCISIDPRNEGHVRNERASDLVEVMFKRYQAFARGNCPKSEFFGSAFAGTVDRLSPSVARDIADDFFSRLYMPMAQCAAT